FCVSSRVICFAFFYASAAPRDLHSFPTRRSSDLLLVVGAGDAVGAGERLAIDVEPDHHELAVLEAQPRERPVRDDRARRKLKREDRKSTRLNSSHVKISYAVFCLKKKKNEHNYH